MPEITQKKPLIRDETLEYIAKHLASMGSEERILNWLKNWGVSSSLIEYPNTNVKWQLVYSVLRHYAYLGTNGGREMLFKIISEALHPLMYGGDKKTAAEAAEDFNKYLEYDDYEAAFDAVSKKYIVVGILTEEEQREIMSDPALYEEAEAQEQAEVNFLQSPEGRAGISTLRDAYQLFMNIVEIFCENPSKPSQELNDAYVKTKKLIIDTVKSIGLHINMKNGVHRIHKLEPYCLPFNNLFTAEKEYTPDAFEINLDGKKLSWNYIRPKMHATYGCIDELYCIAKANITPKPDIQQTLNDVSMLLTKTKNEKDEQNKTKQEIIMPQTPVQKIEIIGGKLDITKFPEAEKKNIIPKINLKSSEIKFDDDKSLIRIGEQNISLPPYKHEYYFCQVMFEYTAKEPVSWDIIYDRMNGHATIGAGRKPEIIRENWQQVNDTMKRVNNRIKEVCNTDDALFSWTEKTVIRNY